MGKYNVRPRQFSDFTMMHYIPLGDSSHHENFHENLQLNIKLVGFGTSVRLESLPAKAVTHFYPKCIHTSLRYIVEYHYQHRGN